MVGAKISLPDVYEPAEDSFLMIRAALAEVRESDYVLEIGTGSGIVSMCLMDHAKVVATDINPHAVKSARLNGVEVIRTDMFGGIGGKFDLIIFNPPYLPASEDEKADGWIECAWDGGRNGRAVINRFLSQVDEYLKGGGRILLLISSLTGIKQVGEKMESLDFTVDEVLSEKHFFERLVVLRGKRISP